MRAEVLLACRVLGGEVGGNGKGAGNIMIMMIRCRMRCSTTLPIVIDVRNIIAV
jgi:hypothetical protein